ncbi:MAG: hypothetical protein FWF81_05180, partial [Defluviitaleaceae bacterium]|nr:hypothetical protein [Defluviitaleaceae bacterium]
ALRRAIIRQKPGNIITIKRLTADFFLNLWTLDWHSKNFNRNFYISIKTARCFYPTQTKIIGTYFPHKPVFSRLSV